MLPSGRKESLFSNVMAISLSVMAPPEGQTRGSKGPPLSWLSASSFAELLVLFLGFCGTVSLLLPCSALLDLQDCLFFSDGASF